MKKILLIVTLLLTATVSAQKPVFTTAKVKAATVYATSAEMTQITTLNLPKGNSEIVIKNVADYVNENTVQIGVPKNVTILSVQFTKNYISEYEIDESNPIIKQVRDSIDYVTKEIKKVNNQRVSYSKTIELLDKNQELGGTNTGLNVAELIKLADYYTAKRTELSNLVNIYIEKEEKLNTQLAKLNSRLEINTQKEEKASKGKLVLQVMNTIAGKVDFDIQYLTQGANWIPFYDLRAENIDSPINMTYKAQVTQNTGVDWKGIKLTLSSGNPNQSNVTPVLQAWFLQFGQPYNPNAVSSLAGKVSGLQVDTTSNSIVLRGSRSISSANEVFVVIDGVPSTNEILQQLPPNSIKSTNIIKGEQAVSIYGERGINGVIVVTTKQGVTDYTEVNENQLTVSFDIDIPYDILSNGKAHSVDLKEISMPAKYKYYSVPKLEKEAFLLAEINDYSKFNLLPGEANIIFEGLYVGKTYINPNETAETFNLSMGRDKRITVKREKVVEKSGTKFLSAYKEQVFTYDIIVRNNKKQNIEMLLKDQYPISTDKEITVELLEKDKAEENIETGVLNWYIKLQPNETKTFRISYKVRYPKDKVIGNL